MDKFYVPLKTHAKKLDKKKIAGMHVPKNG